MAQITSGLKSILSFPFAYTSLQNLLGGRSARKDFVDRYVRAKAGDRILDIGCDPGDIVGFLPEINYVGFDSNAHYIEIAEKRYGGRATFRCENLGHGTIDELGLFDIVLATGVLHHLDDDDAARLLRLARAALKKGGRLITLDACFIEQQSRIARFLISRDRGQNVRTREGYGRLATSVFEQVKVDVRHDLLWVPYTHIILECLLE